MKAVFMGYSSFVSKKTNNPVLLVSIAYTDPNWKGYRVTSSFVDNSILPSIASMRSGEDIDVEVDFSGRILAISSSK